jgi:hypothetical protein
MATEDKSEPNDPFIVTLFAPNILKSKIFSLGTVGSVVNAIISNEGIKNISKFGVISVLFYNAIPSNESDKKEFNDVILRNKAILDKILLAISKPEEKKTDDTAIRNYAVQQNALLNKYKTLYLEKIKTERLSVWQNDKDLLPAILAMRELAEKIAKTDDYKRVMIFYGNDAIKEKNNNPKDLPSETYFYFRFLERELHKEIENSISMFESFITQENQLEMLSYESVWIIIKNKIKEKFISDTSPLVTYLNSLRTSIDNVLRLISNLELEERKKYEDERRKIQEEEAKKLYFKVDDAKRYRAANKDEVAKTLTTKEIFDNVFTELTDRTKNILKLLRVEKVIGSEIETTEGKKSTYEITVLDKGGVLVSKYPATALPKPTNRVNFFNALYAVSTEGPLPTVLGIKTTLELTVPGVILPDYFIHFTYFINAFSSFERYVLDKCTHKTGDKSISPYGNGLHRIIKPMGLTTSRILTFVMNLDISNSFLLSRRSLNTYSGIPVDFIHKPPILYQDSTTLIQFIRTLTLVLEKTLNDNFHRTLKIINRSDPKYLPEKRVREFYFKILKKYNDLLIANIGTTDKMKTFTEYNALFGGSALAKFTGVVTNEPNTNIIAYFNKEVVIRALYMEILELAYFTFFANNIKSPFKEHFFSNPCEDKVEDWFFTFGYAAIFVRDLNEKEIKFLSALSQEGGTANPLHLEFGDKKPSSKKYTYLGDLFKDGVNLYEQVNFTEVFVKEDPNEVISDDIYKVMIRKEDEPLIPTEKGLILTWNILNSADNKLLSMAEYIKFIQEKYNDFKKNSPIQSLIQEYKDLAPIPVAPIKKVGPVVVDADDDDEDGSQSQDLSGSEDSGPEFVRIRNMMVNVKKGVLKPGSK